VELSAAGPVATLTCATGLVLEAQEAAEPVAWIAIAGGAAQERGSAGHRYGGSGFAVAGASFYPPDLADSGVDLDALVVVHAPGGLAGVRAAERLLRSGAFGLVVLDFGR